MLDPKLLRNQLAQVTEVLAKRNFSLETETIAALEEKRKKLQGQTQELQQQRNQCSKEIGHAKAKGEDVQPLLERISASNERLQRYENELGEVQRSLDEIMAGIPNILHNSVPEGRTEEDNREIRRWGTPRTFDFLARDHADLGENLGLLDFEAGARIAGSRFSVMRGALARLHRALIQLMLDTHVNAHGYTELNVPCLVNTDSMRGTGQLPKFEEDLFHIVEHGFYLIPTAEVPITNLASGQILPPDSMPHKYVCHSLCFRSEAGSYGKDTRGMIRQHQFEKVELVQFVRPKDSYDVLEELTGHAEKILQLLELPYRVVLLCSGDTGFSSAKTYDLEVWLPGQQRYREISSCSNFESFQARRMKARWRDPDTDKPELIHTLNGSGLAVGRTLIAVLENGQDDQGRIHLPRALHPYMDGVEMIA